ncbi:MAG: alpha/beta hydrolase [Clostridia bacterium]|nr:alpha/beta hydrolase [Clostridia bacterium]
MINQFMKKNGEKSYYNDIKRIDYSKISKDIKEKLNINYNMDDNVEHSLDIYYRDNDEIKPILIDIHGGGFISNDKELNHLFGNYMAQKGYVVFNTNYRLAYPNYNVFDQIIDVDNALKWIIKNAKNYNGNIDEMYIAGHSSAGVLAVVEALLCKSDRLLKDYNLDKRNYEYKGIILDCGLMNFYKSSIAYWGMRRMIFPNNYKKDIRYQDIIFENNEEICKLPKTILLTNSQDELKDMTYYFEDLLNKVKVENRLIDSGADGHMGIIFKPYTEDNLKIMDEIIRYFKI